MVSDINNLDGTLSGPLYPINFKGVSSAIAYAINTITTNPTNPMKLFIACFGRVNRRAIGNTTAARIAMPHRM